MECGAYCCVCVCLCLCLSLYGRDVTVCYARLGGGMGATFSHLAALRSAIEFLFWDHWETAVLVQILDGGHGSKFLPFGGPSAADCIGKQPFWAKSWPGGHRRSREVTGGYGRLRRGKTEESGGRAGNRLGKNERK